MEGQTKSDRFCWSVFLISSSLASLSGLILLLSGFQSMGAILLSLGIQVSVITLLFYVWSRCWRRVKPQDVTHPLEDPPPPYRSEWRISFLTPRERNPSLQQANISTAASETTSELRQNYRREQMHAITLEETENNMSTRGFKLNMKTSEGDSSGKTGRWSPRILYRSNPLAQYSPLAIVNMGEGLPSYEEAIVRAQDHVQSNEHWNKDRHLPLQNQDSVLSSNSSSRFTEILTRDEKIDL